MDTIYKLLLDFLHWGEPRFRTKANHIVTAMTTEPMLTLLPNPLPTWVATRVFALTALTDYNAAEELAADGSKSAIVDRKEKRAILEGVLKDWAPVLEGAAKTAGSLAILEHSGYDVKQPPQPLPQPLPAPELKVFRNGYSGEMHARAKALHGATGYEGQFCLGNPTEETNWQVGFFSHTPSQMTYTGLTPGQVYSFRLRAQGRGDDWSPWSDIVQMMAT